MKRTSRLVRGATACTLVVAGGIAACRSAPDATIDRGVRAPDAPAAAPALPAHAEPREPARAEAPAKVANAVPPPAPRGTTSDVAASAARAEPHVVDPATRAAFLTNCAACHGERGDGAGTTKLERPARSFLAGGFSYGNTPEAVVRSITHGIPGTPMPSFGATLSDAQRAALAAYVISLGPPQVVVEGGESVMVVRAEAAVARGKLPPLVAGAPEIVRGLLIGLPGGLTFEYDTDDVRLFAVRTGEFCDRRDWVGRGGDALLPLGVALDVAQAPSDRGWATEADPAEVRAELRATHVRGAHASIAYDLVRAGTAHLHVEESPALLTGPGPSGWSRRWKLSAASAEEVGVDVAVGTGESLEQVVAVAGATVFFRFVPRADGNVDLVGVRADLERSGLGLQVDAVGASDRRKSLDVYLHARAGRAEPIVFDTFCIPSASPAQVDARAWKERLAGYAWN